VSPAKADIATRTHRTVVGRREGETTRHRAWTFALRAAFVLGAVCCGWFVIRDGHAAWRYALQLEAKAFPGRWSLLVATFLQLCTESDAMDRAMGLWAYCVLGAVSAQHISYEIAELPRRHRRFVDGWWTPHFRVPPARDVRIKAAVLTLVPPAVGAAVALAVWLGTVPSIAVGHPDVPWFALVVGTLTALAVLLFEMDSIDVLLRRALILVAVASFGLGVILPGFGDWAAQGLYPGTPPAQRMWYVHLDPFYFGMCWFVVSVLCCVCTVGALLVGPRPRALSAPPAPPILPAPPSPPPSPGPVRPDYGEPQPVQLRLVGGHRRRRRRHRRWRR